MFTHPTHTRLSDAGTVKCQNVICFDKNTFNHHNKLLNTPPNCQMCVQRVYISHDDVMDVGAVLLEVEPDSIVKNTVIVVQIRTHQIGLPECCCAKSHCTFSFLSSCLFKAGCHLYTAFTNVAYKFSLSSTCVCNNLVMQEASVIDNTAHFCQCPPSYLNYSEHNKHVCHPSKHKNI